MHGHPSRVHPVRGKGCAYLDTAKQSTIHCIDRLPPGERTPEFRKVILCPSPIRPRRPLPR